MLLLVEIFMVYINELENPQPHILPAIRWEQGTIFARPPRVKDSTREGVIHEEVGGIL